MVFPIGHKMNKPRTQRSKGRTPDKALKGDGSGERTMRRGPDLGKSICRGGEKRKNKKKGQKKVNIGGNHPLLEAKNIYQERVTREKQVCGCAEAVLTEKKSEEEINPEKGNRWECGCCNGTVT